MAIRGGAKTAGSTKRVAIRGGTKTAGSTKHVAVREYHGIKEKGRKSVVEFKKISSPTLRELFVQQLEDLILSGKLKIGEKLPTERQLAESMQVSRSVVNNGLSDLEKKGFLVGFPAE